MWTLNYIVDTRLALLIGHLAKLISMQLLRNETLTHTM